MITTDRRHRRSDPRELGSPAHFAAFVRAVAIRRDSAVVVPEGVRVHGFVVPRDGLWFIQRRWVEPGVEWGTLLPGTVVRYYRTGVDLALPEHRDPRSPPQRAAQVGPQVQNGVVDQSAIYDHELRGRLPAWAHAYTRDPVGLFMRRRQS